MGSYKMHQCPNILECHQLLKNSNRIEIQAEVAWLVIPELQAATVPIIKWTDINWGMQPITFWSHSFEDKAHNESKINK